MIKTCTFFIKIIYLIFIFFSLNNPVFAKAIAAPIVSKAINIEAFTIDKLGQKQHYNLSKNKTLDSVLNHINSLNNNGNYFRDISLFKDALNSHFEALQLAEELNDTLAIINSLNFIGTDLRRTSSNVAATEYHYRAYELAGNNKTYLKSKAIAMNGLGNVFLELKKPDEAIKYFEQSLAIETQLDSHLGLAINYANIGSAFQIKGDLNKALTYYNKSLQHNYIINSPLGIAICKNAIGSIYVLQNNTLEGLKFIRESVNLLQNSQDAFHKLEMQASLFKLLINLNQLTECDNLLIEIFKTAKIINSFNSNQTAYELQTLLSEKYQDYKTAFVAKEMAIAYRDSTLALNNEVKILEIENKYKTKQALQQIKFLIKEKALIEKTKTNQQRIFLLLFLFMSSIIGFTYYLYQNRKKVNHELKKVSELKSRFFGNVSHEFRTPLTLIKGPLEKMLQSKLPSGAKEDLEMMHRNTNKLLNLVNQILNLSKIDAGKFQISAQLGNLANEIRGISQSFEYVAKSKKLDYKIAISNCQNAWFDPEIVEMLITNILSNAFKFVPVNGAVTIKGTSEFEKYTICISNTINNLTPKEIDRFFDRFYTNATSFQQGTGIGLSLVKELCTLYRTTISVNKKDSNTIEFVLVLPTAKKHFKTSEINVTPKFSAQNKNTLGTNNSNDEFKNSTKNEILLIVEDNDDMRNYIANIFNNQYKIIKAKDGEEGLHLAKKHIPDIIISDVMMPKIDGITLCNTLKTDILTNHIPIILLTALSEEENVLLGFENKADDYISKPFNIKILQSKVSNLIQIRKTLSEKYREEIIVKPANIILNTNNNDFNQIIKEVLEKHITNPGFDVKNFCNIASMSRTQLHRKLTATTNMSATEFIRTHRLKLAAKLLTVDNLNISEACYAAGFSDTSYFSKQFKMLYKKSPKKYKDSFA